MAFSKVEGTGEKRLAWRNLSRSLVVLEVMAAWAVGCGAAVGGKDIRHKPLVSLGLEKSSWLSRVIVTWVLVKVA